MAKMVIKDDCLVPHGQFTITFKGPNPFRSVQNTAKFLRVVWEVEAKDYWERQFRYNPDEDPRGFYFNAYVVKGLDRFSKVVIEVIIQGVQPSDPTKEGHCKIDMGGILKTSYGGSTIFEDIKNPLARAFYWFYHKYFYQKQRNMYLNLWCRQRLRRLRKMYQEALGITPTNEKRII